MSKLQDVFNKLKEVKIEKLEKDIVTLGLVRDLAVEGNVVSFSLRVPIGEDPTGLEKRITEKVKELNWVSKVDIKVEKHRVETPKFGKEAQKPKGPQKIERVKHIIVVASGKGGVGKSTVAANLALALSLKGKKVGLFDGDIYGPSIPKMFGIEGLVPRVKDNKMLPVERYGLKLLSIGLMLDEDTPVIWRGPLVHKAYQQFFFDTIWGDLDYLVVDFPPGTGDAQISAIQLVKIDGAVVVTTPQDVALIDVKKATNMFVKMQVPVLGVVENMSYFRCPKCGEITRIFGQGGAEKLRKEMGLPLLGQIPIDPDIVQQGDVGMPAVAMGMDHPVAKEFIKVAEKVLLAFE